MDNEFNKLLFYNPYREHLNRLEVLSTGALSGVGLPLFRHKTIFEKMAKELDEKNQQRFQENHLRAKDMISSGLHVDYPPEFSS